jgi:hypothetical protein
LQFGRWYPLAAAADHAPAARGVLQVRVEQGLVDYPRGKTAMVHYALADDVRAEAVALAARFAPRALLCRHLEIDAGESVDLPAFYEKLVGEFARRFGAEPRPPPP